MNQPSLRKHRERGQSHTFLLRFWERRHPCRHIFLFSGQKLRTDPCHKFLPVSLVCLLLLLLAWPFACPAQPKGELRRPAPLDRQEALQKGRALVADLLAQVPENSTNTGTLLIEDDAGHKRSVPIRFAVAAKGERWFNIYESGATRELPGQQLTVIHSNGTSNQYLLATLSSDAATNPPARKLTPAETLAPFAGSDFWLADLGLEFFHWPDQLLLRQQMRRSTSCNVLESVNPHPAPGAYSRVVSWLDIDSGGIVLAQAFDSKDKLLKEFAPKNFKKIRGQWELKEMDIRNVQTRSLTRVQFDLTFQK
jgi:hypothetical protein